MMKDSDGADKIEVKGVEVERKFLVKELPADIDHYEHQEIRQGYLEDEAGVETRVRQRGDKYFFTTKTGTGLERGETEEEISRERFEELWQKTSGRRLEKIRYIIPVDGAEIELDVYGGDLAGHMVAEIELARPDENINLSGLDWLGDEVTGRAEYSNAVLAMEGWPEAEKVPEYGLDEGVSRLIEIIKSKTEKSEQPVVVEIAGGSASGKTSAVSDKVKTAFGEQAIIISMDDYYRGRTYMAEQAAQGNELNFDQPEVLNLEELRNNLARLKARKTIEEPIYSFKSGEREGTRPVEPAKVVIVEGLFALNDALVDEGDVHAFVDIGTHGRIIRRLLRDVERTGQNPKDILDYFADVVEPMHEKHIQSTKANADIVINNEYMPEIEADRAEHWESQLKFKSEITPEELRRTGAEQISRSHQIDKYHNPPHRDLVASGEMLRIREEASAFLLTYKGPKKGGAFRTRPKFEFEIDKDTEERLLSMYKSSVIIEKDRTVYQLFGVIFSVDKVTRKDGDREEDLGQFVEIRSNDGAAERIENVIQALKLDMSESDTNSYLEMSAGK